MKKVISLLVVFALVLACCLIGINTVVFAAEESPEADFVTFNGVLEEYVGPGGDVVIPASLGIKEIAAQAFYQNMDVISIVIPEGVEIIGGAAFSGCENLVAATLPYSLYEIGQTAFSKCALTEILIPGNLKIIPFGTFSFNCLTKIEFSYGVEEIQSSAFNHNFICDVVFPETVELICGFSFVFPQNSGSWEFTICNPDCEVGYYADTVKKNAEHSWDTTTCPIAYSSLSATQTVTYVVPEGSSVGKYIEDNFEDYLKETAGTGCDVSRNRQIVKYKSEDYFKKLPQNQEDFGIVKAPDEEVGDNDTTDDFDDDVEEPDDEKGTTKPNKDKNSGTTSVHTITDNSSTTLIIIIISVFGGIMMLAIVAVVILVATGKLGGGNKAPKEKKSADIDPETLAAAMAILEAKKAEEEKSEDVTEE